MLSGMPGVEHADVVWDEQAGRGFRQESTVRATVYIRPTSDGHLTPQIVESIREAVAGSKANLAADDVIVMDLSTGMTHRVSAAMTEEPIAEHVFETAQTTAVDKGSTLSLPSEVQTTRGISTHYYYGQPAHDWSDSSLGSSSSMFMMQESPSYSSFYREYDDPAMHSTWVHSSDLTVDDASSDELGVPWETLRASTPVVATSEVDQDREIEPPPPADTPAWATVVAQPSRDRTASTVATVSRDSASNGFALRNDFRFFVWVFVGVIVLVAVMRGLRSSSDVTSPELTITSRPSRSEANGDTEMQKSRMTSPHTQGSPSEHVDSHSSPSHEAFTERDRLTKSESESASEHEADPLAAFEHLGWLDAESIQKLYRCLPDEPWALALSGASTQIQEHVLKSLSRSTSMMLQKRMDSLPAIRLRDVEDAQRRLGEWVLKLDETADVG